MVDVSSRRRIIKAAGGKTSNASPWLSKRSISQAIIPPSSLLASAATGGKNRSGLLLPEHLQAIETLIHLDSIESGGRKQVTSTHNYCAMQLE